MGGGVFGVDGETTSSAGKSLSMCRLSRSSVELRVWTMTFRTSMAVEAGGARRAEWRMLGLFVCISECGSAFTVQGRSLINVGLSRRQDAAVL